MLPQKPPVSYSPEIQLSETEQPPSDTVSKISWGSSSSRLPIFATSNWDSHIRIYQVNTGDKTMTQKTSFSTGSPSFCVNWHPEMTRVFASCAPNIVKEFDVETGKETEIGKHRARVKDVYWLAATQTLCSISADKTIKFWDVRQSGHVGEIKLKYMPHCSDLHENKLLLGLNESKVLLLDVVDLQKTQDSRMELQYIDSPLKSDEPYCSIKFMRDGSAMGLGCLDGRCNLSNITNAEDLQNVEISNIMVWKAQRNDATNSLTPVKCLFVNKRSPDFVGTCQESGRITFWDCQAKSKIKDLEIGSPIACSAMSPDGNLLAFATGENWHRGEVSSEDKQSKIYVHMMQEDELKYKISSG